MRYEKLLERLKKEYPEYYNNDLVTIDEIYQALSEYSKQGVFNFVNNAISKGDLKQVDRGIYSSKIDKPISPIAIINKKYIQNKNNIYGIYGRLEIEPNFYISNQIANTIDVITNKTSSKCRKIKIGYQNVILYKSRCKITKANYAAYTLLELFNSFNIKQFNKYSLREVERFIKQHKIKKNTVNKIIPYFPGKALKNMYVTGVFNALT